MVRRYLWYRVETLLKEERVGEDQVKGLFLQEFTTLVTVGENVAVKRRVKREEGMEDRMAIKPTCGKTRFKSRSQCHKLHSY